MPRDPARTRRLRRLLTAVEVVDLVAGSNFRHAGSVIVMMLTALVGCAVLAVGLGLAGVVIAVLGLSSSAFPWLATAVLWAGLLGGGAGAAIVMVKIVRRTPSVATLGGFPSVDDSDDALEDGTSAGPSPIVPQLPSLTPERIRALDARLSSTPVPGDPATDARVDSVAPEA